MVFSHDNCTLIAFSEIVTFADCYHEKKLGIDHKLFVLLNKLAIITNRKSLVTWEAKHKAKMLVISGIQFTRISN